LRSRLKLTMAEAFALNAYYFARWMTLAETIIHLDGMLPVDREQFDIGARNDMSDPGFQFCTKTVNRRFIHIAVRYIDNVLAQPAEGTR
jgi:hypothetical protein